MGSIGYILYLTELDWKYDWGGLLQMSIDENIKTGLFIPDKQTPHLWYTNKQTYRAMKKDIFALETPEDLEEKYQCYSCSTILDLQYWLHCPYCESSNKK